MVLVVIVVFCVCWSPIQFILFLKAMGHYSLNAIDGLDYPKLFFQIFAHVLAYFNRYVLYAALENPQFTAT